MIVLHYPSYPFKIKAINGKDQVFDPFRKKWVVLTPEEWVRQNILQYLVQSCKYPSSLIAVEKSIQLGELTKRFDIVVYKNDSPWMIIECKEAKVKLDETTMLQILQYQQVLTAQYLFISNGHETLGAKIESGKLHALQNFPEYL
ncbi:MAG: type I restriction enzyme HsdR N-terminal domain-containing protein [Bacteroidetes bacterium]|nr:type I restriction enzyme HsdR N-terminal domain-containing protein [Bacteroidota bacterium]